MAKFVKLTHRNGEPIWVNPTQVMSVAPVFIERDGGNEIGCAVTTNRGTIIATELDGGVVGVVEKMNLGLAL
jgi:hypothetical protein